MARYDLTSPAKDDLKQIALYTKQTWSPGQAKKYRQELRGILRKLAQTPKLGHLRKEIAPGLRSFRAGAHIVFFIESKSGIIIVRILHPSRDIERQLKR